MPKLPREEYLKTLPRKRIGAGALFFDTEGSVLLVKPNYQDNWLIPGGSVDANESPRAACIREIKEEIGLDIAEPSLLAIEYARPTDELAGDEVVFVFDGGVLEPTQINAMVLQAEEIEAYRFVSPDEAAGMLTKSLKIALDSALQAKKEGKIIYTEAI